MTPRMLQFLESVAAAGRRGLREWDGRAVVGANRRGYLEVHVDFAGKPIAILLSQGGKAALRDERRKVRR